MARPRLAPQPEVPGLAARRVAADIVDGVLRRGRSLDEQIDGKQAHPGFAALPDRDRALARRIIATVLRRLGTLRHLLSEFLDRGCPDDAPRVETALLIGAAQILWLDVPDHAAVDLAVRIVQGDRRGGRYAGLVNAVLRRVAQDGAERVAKAHATRHDAPAWLMQRWTRTYGKTIANAIIDANAQESALDLTVKSDPEGWATRLRGRVTPTGTVRIIAHGPIALLPGYAEGAWWVQDAAAALPARLFGDVLGRNVVDLCAAPGGKTAQLALAGADVTAVDRSDARVSRLRDNLARLGLTAKTIVADVGEWQAGPFDAALVDAPCTSTGTIRRHPDIAWLKREGDIATLVTLQARLLARAIELVRPGGTIVYCTCSLEPEEGEVLIDTLVARDPRIQRRAIAADEIPGTSSFVTSSGDLRTLPCHWPDPDSRLAGLDGFYAARLVRSS